MMNTISIPNLEMNVSFACNLKCEYCTHLGRFMKGLVPLEDLSTWYKTWNTKIRPSSIRIMGGEPLLHPDLVGIMTETANRWSDSWVELITNGLLIHKMQSDFFSNIRKHKIVVTISRHFSDPHFNGIIDSSIELLRREGIEPQVRASHLSWFKSYRVDENGTARPYQSDPKRAWDNCCVKHNCVTLHDNYLYHCPQLACYSHAVKEGFVSDDWKVVLGYKPLSPECTPKEIEEFMAVEECDQCCICPEEFEYVDMYEKINVFGHPSLKQRFSDRDAGI